MHRVLFVDDEQKILQGLKRSLRGLRREWEMHFAEGGEEALEILARDDFDVVVSDMRMPGMDGAELLTQVRRRHPEVIRIVLSGHAEMETVMRAIPVTHRYLNKPCPEGLPLHLANIAKLFELISSRDLRRAIGELDQIPTTREVHDSLSDVLAEDEVDFGRLTEIVTSDLALTTEVLRLVNSSFFDAAKHTGCITEALQTLGVNVLQHLLATIPVFDAMQSGRAVPGLLVAGGNTHAQLTADLSVKLLEDPVLRESAFTASILHDVGELILASSLPDLFDRVVAEAARTNRPVFQIENDLMGVSHAEIGAYLLGVWGFPEVIVDAVANHHHPSRTAPEALDVTGAVHVADALVGQLFNPTETANSVLDEDYLHAVGCADKIEQWKLLGNHLLAKKEGVKLSTASGIWELAR